MRGKIKPSNKYSHFRKIMVDRFRGHVSELSCFYQYIKNQESIDNALSVYCDESFTLSYDKHGPPAIIYHVLRIAHKHVLLRELENLSEVLWSRNDAKTHLYLALSVLYSVNLIDYSFKDLKDIPANIVEFFIKEDDDWRSN